LTDSNGSTSPLIVACPVKNLEDELGKPAPTCRYCTTVEEVPDKDAPTVPYARKLNQEQVHLVARARQSITDDECELVDARNKRILLDTHRDDDNPDKSSH